MADLLGYPLIDDSYRVDYATHRGYLGRDPDRFPVASLHCTKAADFPLIPRSEWQQRIADKTAAKSWISDLCDAAGLPVKDQQQTNFCWANAPTHCVEIDRVLTGSPTLVLSAACVACNVNGYVNQGGSGIEAIKYLAQSGTCTAAIWPNTAISRQYSTANEQANAALHKVQVWYDLDSDNDDQIVTCLLNNRPVSVGIPAWGHEVTLTFLVWQNGTFAYGFDNSWGQGWGNNGRGILSGRYSRFDEAGAVASVLPSSN